MTTTGDALTVVDRHVGYDDGDYRIDLVARDDAGHRVRVRVLHTLMAQHSHAVAEVLAPDMTWTELATESPSNWYSGIPGRTWDGDFSSSIARGKLPPEQHESGPEIIAAMQQVADRLLERAAAILV